jgi:hypothetical protein
MLIALLVDSVCNNYEKEMAGNFNMQAMANSGFSCDRAPLRPPDFLGARTQKTGRCAYPPPPHYFCIIAAGEKFLEKSEFGKKNAPNCFPPGQSRRGYS